MCIEGQRALHKHVIDIVIIDTNITLGRSISFEICDFYYVLYAQPASGLFFGTVLKSSLYERKGVLQSVDTHKKSNQFLHV